MKSNVGSFPRIVKRESWRLHVKSSRPSSRRALELSLHPFIDAHTVMLGCARDFAMQHRVYAKHKPSRKRLFRLAAALFTKVEVLLHRVLEFLPELLH